MKIGIELMNFFVPPFKVSLAELAKVRKIDPDKFLVGLMQESFAICPNHHDIVTMGANAAAGILSQTDVSLVGLVIMATETGLDYSKASSLYLIDLLGIGKSATFVEIKQACFASTAALEFAKNWVLANPKQKVLVIAADIARYENQSAAEATSGAGAVAMIISANPAITVLDKSVSYSDNVDDFYRPNNCLFPIVNGRMSVETYLEHFQKTADEFFAKYDKKIDDYVGICMHIPYAKLGVKAIEKLTSCEKTIDEFRQTLYLNQQAGNIYNGSLYLNLIGLLSKTQFKKDDELLMFAYGSGATSRFFCLCINNVDAIEKMKEQFNVIKAKTISVHEYDQICFGKEVDLLKFDDAKFIKVIGVGNETKYIKR